MRYAHIVREYAVSIVGPGFSRETCCGIQTPQNPREYEDGWTQWPASSGFLLSNTICPRCLESGEFALYALSEVP